MKKTITVLLGALCVALAGVSFLLWQKLREARTAAESAAALQASAEAKVASLEKRERTLQAETTSLRQQASAGRGARAGEGPNNGPGGRMTIGRGGPMQAMESPEMRRLMAVEQKGRLDGRYATLFKSLKLPPEQLEKLKQLLVDKQSVPMDVMAEMRAQGLMGPESRSQIQAAIAATNKEIDDNIRSSLGDTAYEQYQRYEQTQSQRNVVDQLTSRLSYTDSPLSSAQAEQLISLLAANSTPASPAEGGAMSFAFAADGPGGGGAITIGGGNRTTVTNETIAAAQSLLSTAQVDALRQLQAEQQAQQQMFQTMRQNFGPPGGGTTTVISGPTGTTTTTGRPNG